MLVPSIYDAFIRVCTLPNIKFIGEFMTLSSLLRIRRWNKALSDYLALIISVFSRCLLLSYSIRICLRNLEVFKVDFKS